jgi:hypothetical protein
MNKATFMPKYFFFLVFCLILIIISFILPDRFFVLSLFIYSAIIVCSLVVIFYAYNEVKPKKPGIKYVIAFSIVLIIVISALSWLLLL